jgi:hypothetical protein
MKMTRSTLKAKPSPPARSRRNGRVWRYALPPRLVHAEWYTTLVNQSGTGFLMGSYNLCLTDFQRRVEDEFPFRDYHSCAALISFVCWSSSGRSIILAAQ